MKILLCAVAATLFLAAPASAQQRSNVIALAISGAPAGQARIILSSRGDSPGDVVRRAYLECYKRAPAGYMHTCQVSYGTAWVVGSECVVGSDRTQNPIIDIQSDDASPRNAIAKSVQSVARTSGDPHTVCRELAEYIADDVETARSVAIDKPH